MCTSCQNNQIDTIEHHLAGAVVVAADVLAVQQWLKERCQVLVCQLVKKAAVCQSVGSLS